MDDLTLSSYAKINLGLLLLQKRNDGYHTIATVFQQIDLCDVLTFRREEKGIGISSNDPFVPTDETNLAVRAFLLFQEKSHIREGLSIYIRKKIPMGAGLGGGSSNAAVTLKAVNRLWGNPLSEEVIFKIALEIGSDVPFFLKGGIALGEGRGEILTPLTISKNWWIVLVYPGIHVSTSWAYQHARISLTIEEKIAKFRSIFCTQDLDAFQENVINELEDVVFQRHPNLRSIKEGLLERGAFYASMSGSGSSIFGLFDRKKEAERAITVLSKSGTGNMFLCRPVAAQSETS